MKHFVFAFAICALGVAACKSDPFKEIREGSDGTTAALFNGQRWEPQATYAGYLSTPSQVIDRERFHFHAVSHVEGREQRISFSNIRVSPARTTVYPYSNSPDTTHGGFSFHSWDYPLATYQPIQLPGEENFVQILSYDSAEARAIGIFQITFLKDIHGNSAGEFPDTVRFSSGIFNVRIREK